MKINLFVVSLLISTAFASAEDKPVVNDSHKGFETTNIVLYQSNDTLEQRIPDVHQLADYIKQLQAVLGNFFVDTTAPETFHTVVALRPGKRVRVWFVASKRSGEAQDFDTLRKNLEAIVPIDVQGGPVAFAISGKLAGGDAPPPPDDKNFRPPIPKEWQDAVKDLKQPVVVPEGFLDAVWPDSIKSSSATDVPDGFVFQPLEATGGHIAMPKGWFYNQGQKGTEVIWILSKEDPKLGPYQTGVKIQFFASVKEPSGGKTPQEFCQAFLDNKQKTTKVVSIFPERTEGMFTRKGLEDQEDITEAGVTRNYHVIYTIFWTNEKDMAVVMVAGAPSELWSQYEKIFNVMSDFELLDMSKLQDAK